MSGRLVILPKKSWHVWNPENIDKVKRDERLDREAKEKKEKESRDATREYNLNLLKNRIESGDEIANIPENKSLGESFRLFEDVEKKSFLYPASNHGENAEYVKEREELEQLKRRREGIAHWGLGEGAAETSKAKPWYHYASQGIVQPKTFIQVRGQFVFGQDAQLANKREALRKVSADPMSDFLKYSRTDETSSTGLQPSKNENPLLTLANISSTSVDVPNSVAKNHNILPGLGDITTLWGARPLTTTLVDGGKGDDMKTQMKTHKRKRADSSDSRRSRSSSRSVDSSSFSEREADDKKKKSKKSTEHRNESEPKNLKRSKSKADKKLKHRHRKNKHRNKDVSLSESVTPTNSLDETALSQLRRKRLEREDTERRRAAALLSSADIYGLPVDNSTKPRKYNQQFFPSRER